MPAGTLKDFFVGFFYGKNKAVRRQTQGKTMREKGSGGEEPKQKGYKNKQD
jgi:hypothetical protein